MAELVGPTHGEPGYYRGLRGRPLVEARASGFPIGALNPVHDAGYRYASRPSQLSRSTLRARSSPYRIVGGAGDLRHPAQLRHRIPILLRLDEPISARRVSIAKKVGTDGFKRRDSPAAERELKRVQAKVGELTMKLEIVEWFLEKKGYGEELKKLKRSGEV